MPVNADMLEQADSSRAAHSPIHPQAGVLAENNGRFITFSLARLIDFIDAGR